MSAEDDQQKGTGQATRIRMKISQSLLKTKVKQGPPLPRKILTAPSSTGARGGSATHPQPAPARAELSGITW